MNPRERFLAVFSDTERKKLDRVPTFIQGVLGGFIDKNESALFDGYEGELTYNPGYDASIILGYDGQFAGIPQPISHDSIELLDKDGKKYPTGLGAQVGKEGSTYYHRGLLWCIENLETLRQAVKIMPTEQLKPQLETTFKYYEDMAKIFFPLPYMGGIFDTMWMAMGMNEFSKHYRKRDNLYFETIRFYGENMCTIIEKTIEATGSRAKAICIGDDVAFKGSPMISPERWETDIGPYYKKVCSMMRDAGIVPLMHTDGDITTLLPAFQRVGLAGVQGWEGGMDPVYVNEKFPDFVVIGFGDVGEVLPFGTKEVIEAHVKGLMDVFKENRHYVFGPSTVIQKEVPLENAKYFMAMARKYGKY
jgi:uroporphyrinogen-III decarboxylase